MYWFVAAIVLQAASMTTEELPNVTCPPWALECVSSAPGPIASRAERLYLDVWMLQLTLARLRNNTRFWSRWKMLAREIESSYFASMPETQKEVTWRDPECAGDYLPWLISDLVLGSLYLDRLGHEALAEQRLKMAEDLASPLVASGDVRHLLVLDLLARLVLARWRDWDDPMGKLTFEVDRLMFLGKRLKNALSFSPGANPPQMVERRVAMAMGIVLSGRGHALVPRIILDRALSLKRLGASVFPLLLPPHLSPLFPRWVTPSISPLPSSSSSSVMLTSRPWVPETPGLTPSLRPETGQLQRQARINLISYRPSSDKSSGQADRQTASDDREHSPLVDELTLALNLPFALAPRGEGLTSFLNRYSGGLPEGDAVSLGGGDGGEALALAMRHGFKTVFTVDHSQMAYERVGAMLFYVGQAVRHCPIVPVLSNMMSFEAPPGSVSLVVANHSIEYLPSGPRVELLRRVSTWLKPGGMLFAAVHLAEGERLKVLSSRYRNVKATPVDEGIELVVAATVPADRSANQVQLFYSWEGLMSELKQAGLLDASRFNSSVERKEAAGGFVEALILVEKKQLSPARIRR